MDTFISYATVTVISLFLVGLLAYGIMLLLYVLNRGGVRPLFDSNPQATFGLPISAAAAFAIVMILGAKEHGTLQFTAFGLHFEGPAAPITVWIVIFLALVSALRLMRK